MKTYLHKPIKILQIPSRGKIKKYSTNILAFSKIRLQAEWYILQKVLYHVIPVCIIVTWSQDNS